MISIKQIKYALAVERQLHFRKAAEECAISQSALSSALTEMENQLGFQIFERDNKKVLVTARGQQLLYKAREVNMHLEEIMKLSRADQSPLSGPLSIGLIPTVAPYLLPTVLPTLRAQYPSLRLQIEEQQSAILLDKVHRGDLDCAVIALPYNHNGLLSFPFYKEDFYWVSSARQNSQRKTIKASKVIESDLLLLAEGHCLKDHALEACALQASHHYTVSDTSLATLVQLAAAGMGSTLVPEIALPYLVNSNSALTCARLNEPGPHRSLAFIIRPNFTATQDIQLLAKLFSKQLKAK